MARVPAEVHAERFNDVREALVTLAPIATVRYQLSQRWKVPLATVATYIRTVRQEWRDAAELLERESGGAFVTSRRDLLRKALERQAMRATQKKQLRRVMEQQRDGTMVEVSRMVTVPDEHTFSRAVRELIELDNVRVTPEIRITGAVGTTMTAGPNAYRELLAQLRGERVGPVRTKAVGEPSEGATSKSEGDGDEEDLNDA